MGYVVRMPQMGMEMEEGVILEWAIEEGESIEADERLVTVESEKASNDVEAREDGLLRRILVEEGGGVPPGTPIGIVAGPDEDLAPYEAQLEDDSAGHEAPAGGAERGEGPSERSVEASDHRSAERPTSTVASSDADRATSPSPDTGDSGTAAVETEPADESRIRATPGARDLASSEDVDLTAVNGTGPQGVITEDDVSDHLRERKQTATSAPESASKESAPDSKAEAVRASPGARRLAETEAVSLGSITGTGPEGVITEDDVRARLESEPTSEPPSRSRTVAERRQLTSVQSTVAERLGESYRSAIHVTVERAIDAGPMRSIVDAAEASGVDVSLTDLLVKSIGTQLEAHPEFNALVRKGEEQVELELIEEVNVAVAVDVEAGLVTPVVPNVATSSIESVAETRRELTERAIAGEYTTEELSGGTFTVSNLGMFGVDSFDPIINPPQVAILGVGRIRENGRLTTSLSFDHRVVNGVDAARFLGDFAETATDLRTLASFFDAEILG